jgi:NADPH-dependent 2,4-dienoyl-CoA reductase/sulfur reductase-like enzyme
MTEGKRVVIAGAGWIGCEAAAAARKHGAQVTVVDPLPLPLHTALGDTIGALFRDVHESEGVTFRFGVGVAEFTGADGLATGVRLDDGTEVPADVVLVAVGAKPRTELAQDAGLTLAHDSGVVVDETLRTSATDVFAIGDIASHQHPRYGDRLRVEHWANAKDQGTHVAKNVLGGTEPYSASPYFFSDQYDLGMELRGRPDPFGDELVVRGDLDTREFIAFWLRDGAVQAAMNVNMWDDGDTLQALVDARARVEPAKLVDADLASLLG